MSMSEQGITNGARKTTDALKGVIDDVVTKGSEYGSEALTRSKERLNHALDAAGEGADKASKFVTKQMHERPVATAATALGAGILLGLLMARR